MERTGRREFLRQAVTAAAVSAAPALLQSADKATTRRPNILLINLDDHKADTLGFLGNKDVKTPNLDKLFARGTVFNRAYTMGAMIGAVCLPSRTMMLTGRSLFRLAGAGNKVPGTRPIDRECVLPTPVKAAGYETFHMGKSGNECKVAIDSFDHNIVSNGRGAERAQSSQEHADRTIAFLRGRKADHPFFIYLAPPVPHDPRVAPKEFMDLYDPDKISLPANYLPQHPFDNGHMTVRDECLAPWPRTEQTIRRHLADYYGCITCIDHHLGRIFDCLKELAQFDNTVILFIGDNGLSMGDHGLLGKQNLYEFGGMHVPLCIAGPGIPAGRSDAMVYLMDLYPTVCELAGAKLPEGVEAKSILPVVQGKTKALRDALYTAYMDCQRSVRDDRWKLIRYPLVDKTQLYDLSADPREKTNLADRPEHAAKLAEMTALLTRQQKLWGDPAPLKVDNPKPADWTPPAKGGKDKKSEKKRKK